MLPVDVRRLCALTALTEFAAVTKYFLTGGCAWVHLQGVRRSQCRKERLQLHAGFFCEVSVLHTRVQGCSSLARGKTTGNRRGFVEASRGEDLAEQGLVAINIGSAGERKTKETGTEGSGGREGEQGRPTTSEGSYGCRQQRSRHSTGPAPSEEANELGSLEDNKPAPLRAQQLGVGAFFAVIEAFGVDVEVAHQNIAGNCSPGFAANPGSSTLEREATGAQDARTGASSAVVAERVGSTKTLFSMCNSSIKRRSGRWRLSGYGFCGFGQAGDTPSS